MGEPRQLEMCLPPRGADEVLKERKHLAFLAYEAATLDGDIETAKAARQRFLAASQALQRASTQRRVT